MPALVAFGRKWKIASDDFVYPYCFSIFIRLIWLVLITLILVYYDKNYECKDESLLKIYVYILGTLHVIMLFIEAAVVVISSRGTIADPKPRRYLSYMLYLQMIFFLVEFSWDVVGVIWAYNPRIDCDRSHQVLIFTRVVLVWNLIISGSVGTYLVIRIGLCRCLEGYCDPQKIMWWEKTAPVTTVDGENLKSINKEQMTRHRRQRQWQCRVQCLRCLLCTGGDPDIYLDMSTLLSETFENFRGYVPSDIIAGFALHAMKHRAKEYYDSSATRKFVNFQNPQTRKHFDKIVQYAKFSAAAYGQSLYILSRGVCYLPMCQDTCCCCCGPCSMNKSEDIEGDFRKSDIQTIVDVTGIRREDVFYCSFKAEVLCPAFYVAYDHEMEAVVLVVRGTLSIKDLVTCLVGVPKIVKTLEEGDIYGHKGMLRAAHAIQLNLEKFNVLQKVFQHYPNYQLVICGHSLGAGTGSLLGIILKPYYPTLQCYAYSPPGCVINMGAVPYTRTFITSVVFENEIVSRLSSESLEQFNLKILYLLQTSNVPKYRIMMDSLFYLSGCCRYCLKRVKRVKSVTDMLIDDDPLLQYPDYDETNIYDVVADAKEVLSRDMITGKSRLPSRGRTALYLPGRIVHVSKGRTIIRCCGLCNKQPLQAHWTVQSEFTEIVIDGKIISSHFPYNGIKQLLSLQKLYKEENERYQAAYSPLSPY